LQYWIVVCKYYFKLGFFQSTHVIQFKPTKPTLMKKSKVVLKNKSKRS